MRAALFFGFLHAPRQTPPLFFQTLHFCIIASKGTFNHLLEMVGYQYYYLTFSPGK
jgi:hypothetical protein